MHDVDEDKVSIVSQGGCWDKTATGITHRDLSDPTGGYWSHVASSTVKIF